MNESQMDAMQAVADQTLNMLCQDPEVKGGCVLVLQQADELRAVTSISMQFPSGFRSRLPGLFRDIALSVEKDNLLAGVKTEPLGHVETEILHSETRHT